MLGFTEDYAPCFFGHYLHIADLFEAFEHDLLRETVRADGLVSGITDPNYLTQMFLAEVSCKPFTGFTRDRNEIL